MKLSEAKTMAEGLMKHHGLHEWRFDFADYDVAGRFGLCNYDDKLITLSERLTLLNPEREVRNTILHEIAHALAGYDAHHGEVWKATARAIGARPLQLQQCRLEGSEEVCCEECGDSMYVDADDDGEFICDDCRCGVAIY